MLPARFSAAVADLRDVVDDLVRARVRVAAERRAVVLRAVRARHAVAVVAPGQAAPAALLVEAALVRALTSQSKCERAIAEIISIEQAWTHGTRRVPCHQIKQHH